jgi:hypothetical protein
MFLPAKLLTAGKLSPAALARLETFFANPLTQSAGKAQAVPLSGQTGVAVASRESLMANVLRQLDDVFDAAKANAAPYVEKARRVIVQSSPYVKAAAITVGTAYVAHEAYQGARNWYNNQVNHARSYACSTSDVVCDACACMKQDLIAWAEKNVQTMLTEQSSQERKRKKELKERENEDMRMVEENHRQNTMLNLKRETDKQAEKTSTLIKPSMADLKQLA